MCLGTWLSVISLVVLVPHDSLDIFCWYIAAFTCTVSLSIFFASFKSARLYPRVKDILLSESHVILLLPALCRRGLSVAISCSFWIMTLMSSSSAFDLDCRKCWATSCMRLVIQGTHYCCWMTSLRLIHVFWTKNTKF